ncbi:MAG: translation initiation factor 2 [Pseudomonadota bacterium]
MKTLTIAAMVCAVALTGCQTVKRGTKDEVKIFVQPKSAKITTSLGHECKSPCSLKIKRRKKFTVTATAPGYKPETVAVGRKLNKKSAAKSAVNLVVPGGSALLAIDLITRASFDHDPNPVNIKLKRK